MDINIYDANGRLKVAQSGSPVDVTIFDAKGDLLVGNADNIAARLPVGVNGSTLIADSSQVNGLKWRQPVYGRILAISSTAVSKYRTGWANVSLGTNAYSVGCSVTSGLYDSGITINETGLYLITATVSIAVTQWAMAISKNAPASNVDIGPYLITTHEWIYTQSGGTGFTTHVCSLNANDRIHQAIYTGGVEAYTAESNSRSLTLVRVG